MRIPGFRTPQTTHPGGSEQGRWWFLRLLLPAAALIFAAWFWASAHGPASPVLLPGSGGEWLREDVPPRLEARAFRPIQVVFRHEGVVGPGGAYLEVATRGELKVFADRLPIYADPPGSEVRVRTIALPARLAPGRHEFQFLVESGHGHPLLRVHAPGLGLSTGTSWETSIDGRDWKPAGLARATSPPALAYQFPTTFQAFLGVGPWLLLAFGAGAAGTLILARRSGIALRASQARFALLGLWAALAANNLFRLPHIIGMDIYSHLAYVKFLVERHRLPLATDGWQMFQPPLNYLLSVPVYLAAPHLPDPQALLALRLLPALCGLLQVEVAYRAARAVFPGREDLQVAGTLIGGFLPANIYISQVFGNESLAGLLGSAALLMVIVRHEARRSLLAPRFALALGAVLGLTLLAKVSVLLVIPVLLGFCVTRAEPSDGATPGARLRFLAIACGTLCLAAGWYYARNWVLLGRPFVGGWDPVRGFAHWQDPGYVTLDSLTTFGRALVRPIYAGTAGFWNGLYSTLWLDGTLGSKVQRQLCPPWNYGFLLASALTALAPCAALATGAAALWRRPAGALCLASLAVFVLGIFKLYVTEVPTYGTLKGTYLMGLLPCFAILGAAGMDRLAGRLWTRALGNGLLAAWAVSVYAGYFIVR